MSDKKSTFGLDENESPVDINHTVDDLIHWLDIQQVSPGVFIGQNPWPTSRFALFGGVPAAQCVKAAYLTLKEDFAIHSLHGYFTSPGIVDKPTELHVSVQRDGKSSAFRQVNAVQDGEIIFTMMASFAKPKKGVEADLTLMTGVAHPETLEPASPFNAMATSLGIFDIRLASPEIKHDFMPGATLPTRMWFRARKSLPDDPILHACILTFASDLGTGFGDLRMRIMPTSGGPSLDHVVWYHYPMRMDDWFYLDQTAVGFAGGRGLYRGSIHDITGRTCASLGQELVVREVPHADPNIPTTIYQR